MYKLLGDAETTELTHLHMYITDGDNKKMKLKVHFIICFEREHDPKIGSSHACLVYRLYSIVFITQ